MSGVANQRAGVARGPKARRLPATTGAVVIALLALSAARASAQVASSCAQCGHNLIRNAGAESAQGSAAGGVVAVPDWVGTGGFTAARYAWSGGPVSSSSPGPVGRGRNYFYGGAGASLSTGSQEISLAGDAGLTATLSGWLGGSSNQEAYAELTVYFLTAAGKALSAISVGPVTAAERANKSKMLHRSASITVPKGTTSAKVVLMLRRLTSRHNDGVADDLSLVLTRGALPGRSRATLLARPRPSR